MEWVRLELDVDGFDDAAFEPYLRRAPMSTDINILIAPHPTPGFLSRVRALNELRGQLGVRLCRTRSRGRACCRGRACQLGVRR